MGLIHRQFGRTDLLVSPIALGTVALGVDYGIEAPGEFGRPTREDSYHLLQFAADAGINLFDTAPAYGVSESVLGEALGHRRECVIATKVNIPEGTGAGLSEDNVERAIRRSLDRSRAALRRDVLDIVQVHNGTASLIRSGLLTKPLKRLQNEGIVRFIGVSVYGEEAGLAAIDAELDVIQVAYSVLDQRLGATLKRALDTGTGVIIRSAFLKGVLTDKAQWLPDSMQPLRDAATRVRDSLAKSWSELPAVALQFCLSAPGSPTTLVGARTISEVTVALDAVARGPLSEESLAVAGRLGLTDENLLNPSTWPLA